MLCSYWFDVILIDKFVFFSSGAKHGCAWITMPRISQRDYAFRSICSWYFFVGYIDMVHEKVLDTIAFSQKSSPIDQCLQWINYICSQNYFILTILLGVSKVVPSFWSNVKLYFVLLLFLRQIQIHSQSIRFEVCTYLMHTTSATTHPTWICIAHICHSSCELPLLYLWAIETVSCRVRCIHIQIWYAHKTLVWRSLCPLYMGTATSQSAQHSCSVFVLCGTDKNRIVKNHLDSIWEPSTYVKDVNTNCFKMDHKCSWLQSCASISWFSNCQTVQPEFH